MVVLIIEVLVVGVLIWLLFVIREYRRARRAALDMIERAEAAMKDCTESKHLFELGQQHIEEREVELRLMRAEILHNFPHLDDEN